MKIKVTAHDIDIEKKQKVNQNEYNVTKCEFEFSQEYTNDLVKVALFTNSAGTYKKYIVNNECDIPPEILAKQESTILGVYAYKDNNGELELRYSPEEIHFYINIGSYKKNANNSEPITSTDKEQMEQAIQDMETKVDNLDIEAEKVDKTTTITITKKDGTQEEVEILDGLSLEYNWLDTSLGIKREDEQEYQYVNLKGDKGDAGAIKMIIVQELPETGQEDTIYLVPLEEPESQENRYAEYVYINNAWELLGKIGIEVDLTDYYTKTETNTLLDGKVGFSDYASTTTAGVIKISYESGAARSDSGYISARTWTYTQYQNAGKNSFIGKGTLENVITGKDLTTKAYVDGLVGNISSLIDTINGEVV